MAKIDATVEIVHLMAYESNAILKTFQVNTNSKAVSNYDFFTGAATEEATKGKKENKFKKFLSVIGKFFSNLIARIVEFFKRLGATLGKKHMIPAAAVKELDKGMGAVKKAIAVSTNAATKYQMHLVKIAHGKAKGPSEDTSAGDAAIDAIEKAVETAEDTTASSISAIKTMKVKSSDKLVGWNVLKYEGYADTMRQLEKKCSENIKQIAMLLDNIDPHEREEATIGLKPINTYLSSLTKITTFYMNTLNAAKVFRSQRKGEGPNQYATED